MRKVPKMNNAPKVLLEIKTTTERLITLPQIADNSQGGEFRTFLNRTSKDNERLQRVLEHSHHLFNHLDESVVLRLATPRELACDHDLDFGFMVDQLAERHNLKHCYDADALRLAYCLPSLRASLPESLLRSSWRIHMHPMDFRFAGDMFISGFGYPSPVFEINLYTERRLGVKWLYQGQSYGAMLDDPIIFRK